MAKYDNLYEEMVFSLDRYNWGKSDEEARKLMWNDIATFLQMLLRNEYVAKVYDDDTDIIVVQYEHDEKKEFWGCGVPMWVNCNEVDEILHNRENDKLDTHLTE